jgi:murein DD-endopeptidase MepM/ murein hydrolase activator NlpD
MCRLREAVGILQEAVATRCALRSRHWRAPSGALRLRYLATLALTLGAGVLTAAQTLVAAGPAAHAPALLQAKVEGTPLAVALPRPTQTHAPSGPGAALKPAEALLRSAAAPTEMKSAGRFALLAPPEPTAPQVVTIAQGGTLSGALTGAGLSAAQAYKAVEAARAHINLRRIRPGQTIALELDRSGGPDAPARLVQASIAVDPVKTVVLRGQEDGAVAAQVETAKVTEVRRAEGGVINGSLYGAAQAAGVPIPVIGQLIHVYSWDVDFQRDIQPGDRFEVLYTVRRTEGGAVVGAGEVLYAGLEVGGQVIRMYRFVGEDGVARYYGPDGQGAKRGLMRTPVDGARISSGFGMRKHPILGYSKMHKGMDFAAPTGTPVYAAGDGVVERANRFSTYGNYIRIRHNASTKTVYAHLKGFAKGVKARARVEQGQVIGYVGSTGRSTGPHLHYEVIINGTQVNPAKVRRTGGERLAGADLRRFKDGVAALDKEFAALSQEGETRLAAAQ